MLECIEIEYDAWGWSRLRCTIVSFAIESSVPVTQYWMSLLLLSFCPQASQQTSFQFTLLFLFFFRWKQESIFIRSFGCLWQRRRTEWPMFSCSFMRQHCVHSLRIHSHHSLGVNCSWIQNAKTALDGFKASFNRSIQIVSQFRV